MRVPVAVALLLSVGVSLAAGAKVDKRLYAAKTVYVVPFDDLGDDKPVASCFADRLKASVPLEPAASKDVADLVLKIKANIPSATKRAMVGMVGGTPSGHLYAELADGTKVWDDGAKLRRAIAANSGQLISTNGANTVECGIADELLDTLRKAMRESRDTK